MPFGAFAPLPIRLGTDELEGWSATQHARVCADLLAARRAAPLIVMQVSINYAAETGVIVDYLTQQENTVPIPAITVEQTGGVTEWRAYLDVPGTSSDEPTDDGRVPCVLRGASVGVVGSSIQGTMYATATGTRVEFGSASALTEGLFYIVVVYGEMRRSRTSIGDYGGSLTKADDVTENPIPYAASIYRDLQQQRGSAYTVKVGTMVHAENLAIARQAASIYHRLPDKLRNNASGPLRSDDGLDYWSRSLGLSRRAQEPKSAFRERAALHRKQPKGATYDELTTDVSALLGDAFVGIVLNHDGDFENPPTNTYWPAINPGPVSYNIGGGTWLSERAQIVVEAQQPGGMSEGEYKQLMNVDLFQLLDRAIPAWATTQWWDENSNKMVFGEFLWGDGSVWGDKFDWNA